MDRGLGEGGELLTHRVDEELLGKAPSFTFVTDGITSALDQAKAVAGEKDVSISGGANVAQQCLRAGLVDEMQLHIAPFLLGTGKKLFDQLDAQRIKFEQDRAIQSPLATHLRYRLTKQ